MVLFIILLFRFICMRTIKPGEVDLISQIYQIMDFNILKNWSYKYSSHYFIKFIVLCQFIMLLTQILFHYVWFLTIIFWIYRSIINLNQ